MRFTTALLAGALAAIASAQSGSATLNPVQASQAACLDDCEDGDVKCQSYCITVPSPNEDQVNDTTECAANCDQGDGSASDTEKFSVCVQKCISDNYWKTEEGTPRATGGASKDNDDSSTAAAVDSSVTRASASATVTDAATRSTDDADSTDDATATDDADSTDDASETSGTASGTAAQSTETDSAAPAVFGGISIIGLFAAVLAL